MEKLKKYISEMNADDRADFAARCGTTLPFLRNVMYGSRKPGEKLCVLIERESQGAITRQDLREDWIEIWPELAQEEGTHA